MCTCETDVLPNGTCVGCGAVLPAFNKQIGKFRKDHPRTSTQAAMSVYPLSHKTRKRVYEFIRDCGGATDEEQQDGLEMNPSTQRPRRIELVEEGYVVDSGRTRLTRSGRSAIVWVIV